MLDDGMTINLRKLKDSYVQMKLHKVFRLLKLQHPKDNVLAFRKRTSQMHENMSLVKLVVHLAEKEKKVESEPDDSSITDSDESKESYG